jgi:hypothetical protein
MDKKGVEQHRGVRSVAGMRDYQIPFRYQFGKQAKGVGIEFERMRERQQGKQKRQTWHAEERTMYNE